MNLVQPLNVDNKDLIYTLYLAAQVYHMAKQSFHTAKPDRLVGREREMETVNQFVRGHMTKKTAGSLYISGAPGTGKTAVLTHILDNVKVSLNYTQTCERNKFINDFLIVGLVWFMVFNVTFNNIPVISWRSVLLVEETGVPGENHQPIWNKILNIILYRSMFEQFMHNVISL